jgi:hypothetical protein
MNNGQFPGSVMHHHFVSPNQAANDGYDMISSAVASAVVCASMPFISDHPEKRERDDGCNSTQHIPVARPSAQKKSRRNTYVAPRHVPATFTGQMGSLVVTKNINDPRQVGFRRQLSSSKIEGFLGDHDAMEVDTETTRPRSMSF